MYIPSSFRVSDPETLCAFIEAFSFATLVTATEAGPTATHLPLMMNVGAGTHGTLVGHMARANPHWREFETAFTPSLAIFSGPHAYISPAWYSDHPAVPTWNYAAVHVYGRPVPVQEPDRVAGILDTFVERYESARDEPWRPDLPAEFRDYRANHDQQSSLAGLNAEGVPRSSWSSGAGNSRR